MHKIPAMKGKRDSLHILKNMIGFDGCLVEITTKKQVNQNLKRGNGCQRQANVALA